VKKSIVIVIPVWKEEMTEFEKISFMQCLHVMKGYTVCMISYIHLNIDKYLEILNSNSVEYRLFFFEKSIFDSVESYNHLMMSVEFYINFIQFKYILIYQLDCFVFRDDLLSWINYDYSYIGAPWVEGYDLSKYGNPVIGVGNGGFSLRRVEDHLKALLLLNCKECFNIRTKLSFFAFVSIVVFLLKNSFFILKQKIKKNNFSLENYNGNEDIFWSEIAGKQFCWFKIPDWKIAAQFAVEVQPRYFFELNNQLLPFGCHAWWRYDLDFWKPHIEKFGYHFK
jgi:hypothetical protein